MHFIFRLLSEKPLHGNRERLCQIWTWWLDHTKTQGGALIFILCSKPFYPLSVRQVPSASSSASDQIGAQGSSQEHWNVWYYMKPVSMVLRRSAPNNEHLSSRQAIQVDDLLTRVLPAGNTDEAFLFRAPEVHLKVRFLNSNSQKTMKVVWQPGRGLRLRWTKREVTHSHLLFHVFLFTLYSFPGYLLNKHRCAFERKRLFFGESKQCTKYPKVNYIRDKSKKIITGTRPHICKAGNKHP